MFMSNFFFYQWYIRETWYMLCQPHIHSTERKGFYHKLAAHSSMARHGLSNKWFSCRFMCHYVCTVLWQKATIVLLKHLMNEVPWEALLRYLDWLNYFKFNMLKILYHVLGNYHKSCCSIVTSAAGMSDNTIVNIFQIKIQPIVLITCSQTS